MKSKEVASVEFKTVSSFGGKWASDWEGHDGAPGAAGTILFPEQRTSSENALCCSGVRMCTLSSMSLYFIIDKT